MAQKPEGEPLTIRPRSTIRRRANCARFLHRIPPDRSDWRSSSVSRSSSRRPTVAMISVAAVVPPASTSASRIGRQYSVCGRSEPFGALTGSTLGSDPLGPLPEGVSPPRRLPRSLTWPTATLAPTDGSSPNSRRNTVFGVSTNGSACSLRCAYTSSSRTTSGAISILRWSDCNHCNLGPQSHHIHHAQPLQSIDIRKVHFNNSYPSGNRLQA